MPGITVAAVTGDVGTMRRLARSQPIHVALIDVPAARALEAAEASFEGMDRRPIMILTATSDRLLRSLPALATCDGLLLADRNLDKTAVILRLAENRLCVLPKDVAPLLLGDRLRRRQIAELTERERAMLKRLAAGETNRQIGEAMHMPETMVKAVLRSIMLKLNLRNRTQAAVFAVRYL